MKIDTSSRSRFLHSFLKPFYPSLLLGCLVMLVTDACQLYVPEIIAQTIVHIKALLEGNADASELNMNHLYLYCAVVTLLLITRHYWRVLTIGAARKMAAVMKRKFFDHVMSLSQEDIDEMKTGDLMSRVTSDITSVWRMVAFAFVIALDTAVHMLCIFAFVYFLSPELFWWAMPPMMLGPFVFQFIRQKLHDSNARYQEMTADLSTVAQESFAAVSVIKSFATEDVAMSKFNGGSRDMAHQRVKIVFWESFLAPFANLLIGMSVFMALYKGAPMVLSDQNSLTAITLIKILMFIMMLDWPTRAVGMVVGMIQRGNVSLERLRVVFEKIPQQDLSVEEDDKLALKGRVTFKNLNFSYRDSEVLHDIDLDVKPGEKIGVIGAVGSGKSTLLSLLGCLYAPNKGELLIDHRDILDYEPSHLRRRMGCVTQEPFLFSLSIRENLEFGLSAEASDDVLIETLEAAQIHDEIFDIPEGLEAMLGERGVNLSGGQKQRVTIARALVVKPDIFIFDDCFSALDSQTEESLMEAINRYCEGKTTFIAAHRMSAVQNCDRVIVLEAGRIVECGSPQELLKNQESYYTTMFNAQSLEVAS